MTKILPARSAGNERVQGEALVGLEASSLAVA